MEKLDALLRANVTLQSSKEFWHAINWRAANKRVNQLRSRIYRATVAGDKKRVARLQKLMLRSTSNKLLAIRKVTQKNAGKKTPGIDKITVKTHQERAQLLEKLSEHQPEAVKAVNRVNIPKANGKSRPLGIPTILDRCWQAIVKSSLEPYWEAHFERTSYGFRPGRCPHDAIERVFVTANAGKNKLWVLDADIEGAFDNIAHDFLLNRIGKFPGRHWITAWLKAGVVSQGKKEPTSLGVPQGGVISPLLLNVALHGMESCLGIKYCANGMRNSQNRYALVRYADDFVIFASTRESCEQAKTLIVPWLSARGLTLSEAKTSIRHIEEGIDFLGFNIKHYRTSRSKRGKILLTKPSKESVKTFRKEMRQAWRYARGLNQKATIEYLNPKIKGWANYYKHAGHRKIFGTLDRWMWRKAVQSVYKRHPHKSWRWQRQRYWGRIPGRNDRWVFMDKSSNTYLWKLAWTRLHPYILVRGDHVPDNPSQKAYWQKRQTKKGYYKTGRPKILWVKQKGCCVACYLPLDNGETVHMHHKIPKSESGSDSIDNLCLIHDNCHRQVHSKHGKATELNKLLERSTG